MLRLATERDSLNVVADQFGAPTGAELIADVTALLLSRVSAARDWATLVGTYHLAAAGETSWYGFARYVLQHAELNGTVLKVSPAQLGAISTEAYPLPAPRPRNSRLDLRKIEHAFQLTMPSWEQGVQRMLDEVQR